MVDQVVNTAVLAAFWQVAFTFTQTSALPRCLSNKTNTSLWSKEIGETCRTIFICGLFWYAYSLWKMPMREQTFTPNLNTSARSWHSLLCPYHISLRILRTMRTLKTENRNSHENLIKESYDRTFVDKVFCLMPYVLCLMLDYYPSAPIICTLNFITTAG